MSKCIEDAADIISEQKAWIDELQAAVDAAQAAPVVVASELTDEQIFKIYDETDIGGSAILSFARAILAAAPAASVAVPAGWKLVPEVPTAEMKAAGAYAASGEGRAHAAWDRMIAAAPATPAAQAQQPAGALRVEVRSNYGAVLATAIGEEVLIGAYAGHRFVLHNTITAGRDGEFTVSHVETGQHVATADSPDGAVVAAVARLTEKGKDELDKALAAWRKKLESAPAPGLMEAE